MIGLVGGYEQQVLNPIRINVDEDSTVDYQVKVGEEVVFRGQGSGTFSICVNDLVAPCLERQGIVETAGNMLTEIDGFAESCEVVFDKDGDRDSVSFKAFPGGVPGKLFEKYRGENTDIFGKRLKNAFANIFMTDRTDKTLFYMPETELYPLYFIYPKDTLVVSDGISSFSLEGKVGTVYALDLEAVRWRFFNEHGRLSSLFTIKSGYAVNAVVCIAMERPAPERYVFLFRNSFGVLEKIALDGMGTLRPDLDDGQEYYNVYDEVTDDFLRRRDRRKGRFTIGLVSESLEKARIRRVWQLLASEEVHILDGKDYRRVDVTCDEYAYKAWRGGVETLELTVSFDRQEGLFAGSDEMERDGNGIFVEQFNDIFV